MITALFTSAMGFAARHTRALIVLGMIAAAIIALRIYGARVVAADRAKTEVVVRRADAAADDRAGQVAATQSAKTEQENSDARQAAAGSDDPLKSVTDRLRAAKGGDRRAARAPAGLRR